MMRMMYADDAVQPSELPRAGKTRPAPAGPAAGRLSGTRQADGSPAVGSADLDEDRLDWLENHLRDPGEARATDRRYVLLWTALTILLASAVAGTWWGLS